MSGDRRAFLVTGATGNLGEYIARLLVERGDGVLLIGRDESKLRSLCQRLGLDDSSYWAGDMLLAEEADAAAAYACAQFGRLDGLIHLVGSFHMGTPATVAAADLYLELYRSNVLSAVTATSAVVPRLDGGGYLLYLSSLLAEEPMEGSAPYAAAKAALHAWVRALSREVKDSHVHANVVVTSRIDTPVRRAAFPGADHSAWVPADDLAALIAMLTSPAAAGVHGAVIRAVGTFALEIPSGGGAGRGPATTVGGRP